VLLRFIASLVILHLFEPVCSYVLFAFRLRLYWSPCAPAFHSRFLCVFDQARVLLRFDCVFIRACVLLCSVYRVHCIPNLLHLAFIRGVRYLLTLSSLSYALFHSLKFRHQFRY
jgi:hypothetical protein